VQKRNLVFIVLSITLLSLSFLLAFSVQHKLLAATTTPTRTLRPTLPTRTPRPTNTPRPTRTPTSTPTPPATLVPKAELEAVSAANASQFRELTTIKAPNQDVRYTNMAFSPDNTVLAIGDNKGNIIFWDVSKADTLSTVKSFGELRDVAFSPDGAILASASWDPKQQANTNKTKTVALWDVKTGQKTLELEYLKQVRTVKFSPDGKQIVTISNEAGANADRSVRLWDVKTGEELVAFSGHENILNDVTFSPDGTQLASASTDGTVRIWDIKAENEIASLKYTFPLPDGDKPMYGPWSGRGTFEQGGRTNAFSLSFVVSEDGTKILSYTMIGGGIISFGGGGPITDGNFSWTITVQRDRIDIKGKMVSQTKAEGTLKTSIVQAEWTAEPGIPGVRSVAFSQDGKRVITSVNNSRLLIWDLATKNVTSVAKGSEVNDELGNLLMSQDGSAVLSIGAKVRLWSSDTGTSLFESQKLRSNASQAVMNSDGTLTAWIDSTGMIHLWGVAAKP
jgi:WD40 repeat protein